MFRVLLVDDEELALASGYSDFAYAKTAIGYGGLDYCLKPVSEEETPGLLDKLRSRILALRYGKDPHYALRLLSDEGSVRALLHRMAPDSDGCTLLHICSAGLLELLSETDAFLPDECLFWSGEDALLIWGSSPDQELLEAFLEKYQSSALLIIDTTQADPSSFQNSLKRIRMEREGSEPGRVGIVRFSPISDEMQGCFQSLLLYMEENFDQSLTLQSLAHRFGINYTYLSQQFNRATGKSFSEYLNGLRLQAASRLLTETLLKVGDIGEKVGYGDCHYFNNVFKRQYGMTPLQYRKATKKDTGGGYISDAQRVTQEEKDTIPVLSGGHNRGSGEREEPEV